MAKHDKTTAAEDLDKIKLEGDPGTTDPMGIFNDPPVLPNRTVDLNNQKTIDVLAQDNVMYPRTDADTDMPFKALPKTVTAARTGRGLRYFYTGDNLVDEKNVISQPKYTGSKEEIFQEYFKLKTDAERSELFNTMKLLGYYQDGKPSQQALLGYGLNPGDERAMANFMVQLANNKGRTMKALVNLITTGGMKIPEGLGGSGSGRVISVVSPEDAAREAGNAFFKLLGRAPTSAEIKFAVKAVQDNDRSRQLSRTVDPTSLGVAAEQQAKQASPGEFGAYSAGKALNQIFSLMKAPQ